MTDTLDVVLAADRPDWFIELVTEREPRVRLRFDRALYKKDRDAQEQAAFEALLDSAEALLDVPDRSPAELARTVRANPRLRWVHTFPAGGGQYIRRAELHPEELERVLFTTSAGVHARPLSEFALFGVLAGAKRLPVLQAEQRERRWDRELTVRMLDDLTVLVVGLGGIGRETAQRLRALGCRVIGVTRRPDDDFDTVRVEQFAEAASTADAIVLALPNTELTRHLLSADVLAAVKPGATVVNVGRGTTIDESALIAALQDGRVGFAALDVTEVEPLPQDSPLWSLPNVVIAPHIAANSEHNARRIAELFAENAGRLLDGRPLRNRVNTEEFY